MNKEFISISNVEVFGLAQSLVKSGYPMKAQLNAKEYKEDVEAVQLYIDLSEADGNKNVCTSHVDKHDRGVQIIDRSMQTINRSAKLGGVDTGTGHDNFLKGIIVQFDLKYPVYLSPQLQRYNWIDIVSSQSAMHRLTKFNLDDSFVKYTDKICKQRIKKMIELHNAMDAKTQRYICILLHDKIVSERLVDDSETISSCGTDKARYFKEYFPNESIPDSFDIYYEVLNKEMLYHKIISSCPEGLTKTMGISTNYLQLKTILQQRENHKLQDWREICEWIKTLPLFLKLTQK